MPRSRSSETQLVWFRDDLRLADNPALTAAARTGRPVAALYVLEEGTGRRPLGGASRWWLHHSLAALADALAGRGVPLILRRGDPRTIVPAVAAEVAADRVLWNRRYDEAAITVDGAIKTALRESAVEVESSNGSLLVEPWTVTTKTGDWFKVFTPFWKASREKLEDLPPPLPVPETIRGHTGAATSESLESFALLPVSPDWAGGLRDSWTPGEAAARERLAVFVDHRLARYAADRDVPAAEVTSSLSPHLRFGEIGVRTVWHTVRRYAAFHGIPETPVSKFLAELGWREFSYHLLFHSPGLAEANFQRRFDAFPWRDDPAAFTAWTRGRTGYPIVDAGMRQLWATGTIHNRVRMIVASFLVKHLLIHWKAGEEWFWDTLCDADVANNPAGWQWVAGSGADAAPYFRVFNPVLQGEKFDPDGHYVRRWVPELAEVPDALVHKPWMAGDNGPRNRNALPIRNYPGPIVDHQMARDRALAAFEALKSREAA